MARVEEQMAVNEVPGADAASVPNVTAALDDFFGQRLSGCAHLRV